jgi:hypothetical protein
MKASIALIAFSILIVAGCSAPHGKVTPSDSARLHAGMTKEDVIGTLGKPDYGLAIGSEENLTYLLVRPSEEARPFEVKLRDGVVQSYGVIERDPAKVDPKVANFQREMAVPWYSADDYARILTLLPADEARNTIGHDEWTEWNAILENEIRNTGHIPVRVPVQAIQLESWCNYHGVRVDKAAIAAFTEMRLGLERGRSVTTDPREPDEDLFLKRLLTAFSTRN